jgi:serine/threonine-protein phosphatase 2A regulatory subunit A
MQNSKIEAAASALIEDLKSQETKTKINAIKSLSIIALTIGKERTRNELLPYLSGKGLIIFQ